MPGYHYSEGVRLSEEEVADLIAPCALKFAWFLQHKYEPHYWQTLFHTMWATDDSDKLCRFRHLVAGRRGGKTLSAAWEVLYYILHPEEFHWDVHKRRDDRPLYVWVLTKDYPTGKAALDKFRECLNAVGLTHGIEYRENKGNRWFEFENGAFVHFRSAEDPESLRGAGLDILWMDEAAFIPDERAYQIARPALSDKLGIVLATTTPDGKNWLYDEFWSERAKADPTQGRVEYRSIDNPYFSRDEWEYLKEHYHPLIFKQEFMAAFDSMAGKALAGEWLKYYSEEDLPRVKDDPKKLDLTTYIGVDPAISLSDQADRFAISLIGVTKDNTQAYLLDQWAGRIPFPEQVDLIREWHIKYRPQMIGVESQAYQAALAQQTLRLPEFLPIVPMLAKGKKEERILSMAPVFKIGRVRVRKDHQDFIQEWVDYDPDKKNPKDDCLDSVEIALRTAGALLPELPAAAHFDYDRPAADIEELAARQLRSFFDRESDGVDEHMGGEW